jgi:hypothetical protein
MKNPNTSKWIIVGLVLANLLLLFVIMKDTFIHPKPDFKKFIIHELQFDQQQIAAFEKEIKIHRAGMDAIEQKIISGKQQLYALNGLPHNDSSEQAYLHTLGALQEQVEANFMAHFKAIRNLCDTNQTKTFDALTKDFPKFFSKPKRPRK